MRWLAPYRRTSRLSLLGAASRPTCNHWFGTDDLGRDQLSEIMYAGRISLMIGLVVALLSTMVGVTSARSPGYFGKATDQVLSAVTDLFLILPDLALLAVATRSSARTPRRSSSCSRSSAGCTSRGSCAARCCR